MLGAEWFDYDRESRWWVVLLRSSPCLFIIFFRNTSGAKWKRSIFFLPSTLYEVEHPLGLNIDFHFNLGSIQTRSVNWMGALHCFVRSSARWGFNHSDGFGVPGGVMFDFFSGSSVVLSSLYSLSVINDLINERQ